jgi:hypothetical protein
MSLIFTRGIAIAKEVEDFGFSIQVQDGWKITVNGKEWAIVVNEKERKFELESSSGEQMIISSTVLPSEKEQALSLDELTKSFIGGMMEENKDFTILEQGNTTIVGTPANWVLISIKVKETAVNAKIYVVKKDKHLFSIMCIPYLNTDKPFEPILNSLKFH